MTLVSPERASHWYLAKDGQIVPFYEMPKKDGSGMRAPTVKDAREKGLLVSISRIAGILPKPALNAWMQEQAIYAALTLPRPDDEPLDAFARRVVGDMESHSEKAREFGRRIHAQIEDELISPATPCADDIAPFMHGVREWIQNNVERVLGVEKVVGDVTLGIGGKLDLHCVLKPGVEAVVDFKTQGIKNGKAAFYPEFLIQLCGYSHCIMTKESTAAWPAMLSVVIDSINPGPVHVKAHTNHEEGWSIFMKCFDLWCYVNNYRPNGP